MIPIAISILPILAIILPRIESLSSSSSEDCGGTYKGFQYTISSPNYPKAYPAKQKCVYNLVADSGGNGLSSIGSDNGNKCEQEFHLQFLDFDLGSEENCAGDKLQVGDGHVFCGRVSGLRRFTGSNGTLRASFYSDDNEAGNKGFKILVTAMPCSARMGQAKTHSLKGITDSIKSRKNGISSQTYQKATSTEEHYDVNDLKNGNFFPIDKLKNMTLATTTTTQSPRHKVPIVHHSLVAPAASNSKTATTPTFKSSSTAMTQESPRITSYVFIPPESSNANVTVSDQLTSPLGTKSFTVVTSPPNGLTPPQAITGFTGSSFSTSQTMKSSGPLTAWDKSSTSLINVPSGGYGDSGLGVVDYKLNVASNFNGNLQSSQNWDTDGAQIITGKINDLYSDSEFPSQNSVYDPRHGTLDPGSSNVGISSKINLGYSGSDYNNGLNSIPYPNSYPRFPVNQNPLLYDPVTPINPGFNPNLNPILNPSVGPGGECCRVQSARRFSLTSPGFPGNTPPFYSCRHTIVKASPDVCQLRLSFRFFNFGGEDLYCTNGHVEIDGRRYCGCKSGLRLLIPFQEFGTKEFLVNYVGFPRTRFSGFQIDVSQESCRGPDYPYPPPSPHHQHAPFDPVYNPLYSRRDGIQSSSGTLGTQPGVGNGHGFRGKRNVGYSYDRPSIPFPSGNAPLIPNPGVGVGQDRIFGASCQNRIFFDWLVASKESWFRNSGCTGGYVGGGGFANGYNSRRYLPAQKRIEENPVECREINVVQGVIQSPSYPNSYPDNIQSCFRFSKVPNHCQLEVYVKDFQLEASDGCQKDYLSFGRGKYCGESLKNTRTLFDLTASKPVEIHFISDSHGAGRGFTINFSQRPCDTTANF